jgi:hypothetical protein
MDLNNSVDDSDDDDEEFPPLPTDIDVPIYVHRHEPYDNQNRTIDLFYCPSPSLPSASSSPVLSCSSAMIRAYANIHTLTSIRQHDHQQSATIQFARQYKKKDRASVTCLADNLYVNMCRPKENSMNISNEVTYATLINTTSLMPSTSSTDDNVHDHAEYQQIQVSCQIDHCQSHERIYENIQQERRAPPPLPMDGQFEGVSPLLSPSLSCSDVTLTFNEPLLTTTNDDHRTNTHPSAHTYINLEFCDEPPPVLPSRACQSMPATSIDAVSFVPTIPPRKHMKTNSSSNVPVSDTDDKHQQDKQNQHDAEPSVNSHVTTK